MRAASEWDEVWAEYDARRRPAQSIHASVRSAEWMVRRSRLLLALSAILAILALGAALTPLLATLSLARSLRDGDVPAIAAQTDGPALTAAMAEALRRDAAIHHPAGLNPFLATMLEDTAQQLAAPQTLSGALRSDAAVSPHRLVRDVVPLGLDRWEVTLASPDAPGRQARMTLTLAGPMRWQVVGAALPSAIQ